MLAASATAVPVPVARAQASPPLVLTTLHDFAGDDDGSTPHAGLVQGADGSFYGTTDDENFDGSYGTVFKITANGKLTTLHAFSGGDDNGNPTSALIQGADGNFYGTTDAGSGETNNNECTDFRITPAGALTTLHAFPGTEGFEPSALVQATDGNFYGALRGSIYRLTPGGGHAFVHGVADGPTGGLIQGRDGILYCTAYSSSSATGDHGSLFRANAPGGFYQFPHLPRHRRQRARRRPDGRPRRQLLRHRFPGRNPRQGHDFSNHARRETDHALPFYRRRGRSRSHGQAGRIRGRRQILRDDP